MRTSHLFAATLMMVAATVTWSATSRAGDFDSPTTSPDTSPGIEPGETRGMNLPGSDVGRTTITQAQLDMERERVGAPGPNRALLITGVAILVGSYGASAIVGALSPRDEDQDLYVPILGPWVDLGERTCRGPCGAKEAFYEMSLIGSGAAQATGVALAIASMFVPESRRSVPTAPPPPVAVRVVPVSFVAGAGLGAVGTF